jgi:hypothetical protein
MASSLTNNLIYKTSSSVQANTVMNRGILDVGGWLIPNVLMANNKDEQKERLIKYGTYLLLATFSPFIFIPFANRSSLKLLKVTKNFLGKESNIIQIQKEHLAKSALIPKNAEALKNEIISLGEKLNSKKEFHSILKNNPNMEDLRIKIIKAQKYQFMMDFLPLGFAAGSIPWISNYITKKQTGRSGFTAEFGMADKEYTDKMSEKHEKTKHKKMWLAYLTSAISTALIPNVIQKAFTTQKPGQFSKIIKNNAHLFDYRKGIFINLLPYALIDILADIPHWIFASRDKHEMKDNSIRFAVALSIFFGGDYFLNNITGRAFDSFGKTKLMNDKKYKDAGFFKKFMMPVHSLEELKNLKNIPEKTLKNTQKIALGMYWGNMIAIMLALGFGVPYLLNKTLKDEVQKGIKK